MRRRTVLSVVGGMCVWAASLAYTLAKDTPAPVDQKPVPAATPAVDLQSKMFQVMYGTEIRRTEQLKELIHQGVDVNAAIGFDRMLLEGEDPATLVGTTWPLDVAIQHSSVVMVKLLLDSGAKLHGEELAEAALHGRGSEALEMAEALVKVGVDPNSRNNGFTALHWAAYKNNTDLVKLLMSQRDIKLDEFDPDGDTALTRAVDRGSLEIVEMLLQAGASPHVKNSSGETAIHILEKKLEKGQAILGRMKSVRE